MVLACRAWVLEALLKPFATFLSFFCICLVMFFWSAPFSFYAWL
jgi:hypothetical protein